MTDTEPANSESPEQPVLIPTDDSPENEPNTDSVLADTTSQDNPEQVLLTTEESVEVDKKDQTTKNETAEGGVESAEIVVDSEQDKTVETEEGTAPNDSNSVDIVKDLSDNQQAADDGNQETSDQPPLDKPEGISTDIVDKTGDEAVKGGTSDDPQEELITEIHEARSLRDSRKSSDPFASKTDGMQRSSLQSDGRRRRSQGGSKGQLALGSIISIRRSSVAGEYYDRTKITRYMNTYKLDSDNPFNPEKVEKVLESVMLEAFENLTYETDKCLKLAKWASNAIRTRIKEMEFDRYKIICLVTIGERKSQDILVTTSFLWDADRDRYATFTHENSQVFGIAQCFGLYYE